MVKRNTRKKVALEYKTAMQILNNQLKYGERILSRKEFKEEEATLTSKSERIQIEDLITKIKGLKEEIITNSKSAELKNVKSSFDNILKTFKSDMIKKIADSYGEEKVEPNSTILKELKNVLKSPD